MLEIELDLLKSLFRHVVLALKSQISSVDNGIHRLFGVGSKVAATFDAADALEAQCVPDSA